MKHRDAQGRVRTYDFGVLPGPLADRLSQRAGQLRALADRHVHDRINAQEPTT